MTNLSKADLMLSYKDRKEKTSGLYFVIFVVKARKALVFGRQFDGKSGSFTYLACNLDGTFVALNYPFHHRQS